MKTGRKFLASTLLVAAAMSFCATSVNAATLTWAGTDSSNSWNYTDKNWSGGSTFVSGDSATFDDTAESNEVSIEEAITAGTITISSGSYIFTLSDDGSVSAASLRINNGASLEITGVGTFTGSLSNYIAIVNGELTISGGETSFRGTMYVGYLKGDTGTIEISGGKTTFENYVYVGDSGTGKLTISGGETTFSEIVYLGDKSDSLVTMEISGGKTTFSSSVFVCQYGTGELTVSSGETTFGSNVYLGYYDGSSGTMEISGGETTFGVTVYLGHNDGSSGTIEISGGTTVSRGYVYVGLYGTGKLTISGGETTFKSVVYLGFFRGSSGTMEISGGETTFGSTVYVGHEDTGKLTISGGETTFSRLVYIGYNSGSSGSTMEISGGNTTFKRSVTVAAGSSLSLTGGTITLSSAIENSGTVTIDTSGENDLVFVLDNLTASSNTYTLISGEGSIYGWSDLTTSNFSLDGSILTGRSIVDVETAGQVTINYVEAANLVWNGTESDNVWTETRTETNKIWKNSEEDDYFYSYDNVTFADGAESLNKTVLVEGKVAADNVTVTGSDYIFSIDEEASLKANSLTIESAGSLKITSTESDGSGSLTTTGDATISGSLEIANGTTTFGSLEIEGGSLTVSGGDVTVSGTASVMAGGSISVTSGTLTLKGSLSIEDSTLSVSGGKLVVDGTTISELSLSEAVSGEISVVNNGSLSLSDTTLSGATLSVEDGSSLSASSIKFSGGTNEINGSISVTGDLSVGDSASIKITGGSLEISDGLTSTGSITVSADANLSLTGTIDLSSAITNSGTVTVSDNVVFVLDDLTSVDGTYTLISGGAIEGWNTLDESNFSLNGSTVTVDVSIAGQVTIIIEGDIGDLLWNGTASSNVWTNDGEEIWLNGEDSGAFVAGDNVTFGSNGTKSVSIVGAIEAGSVTVTGNGYTFSFSEDSSVTADSLTIDSGASLTLAGSGELTTDSATISGTLEITNGEATITSVDISSEGTLKVSGGTTTADSIEVAGSIELTGGELTVKTITLSDGSGSFSGGVLTVSEITGSGSITFGNGLTVNIYGTTSLTIDSAITLSGTVTFNAAEDDETIDLSGTLSGSGKLVKDGNGTLTLYSDNTYSGGTTISAGTVVANSENALGTGAVAIEDGATLELTASGTFSNTTSGNGTLSITNKATVSFGSNVGVKNVNVASGATLSGSTTLTHSNAQLVLAGALALDASAGEKISFSNGGTVTLEGSATLNLSGVSPTSVKPLSDSSTLGAGSNITIFSGATVEGDLSVADFLATDNTLSGLSSDYAVVYDTSKGLSVMILESGDLSAITHGVRLHDGIGSDFISAIISDDDLEFGTGIKSSDDLQSLSNPIVRALATGNISEASKMMDTLAPNDYAAMVAMPTTSFYNDVKAIDNRLAARRGPIDENARWEFFAQAQGTFIENDDARDTQTFDFDLYGVLAGADYRVNEGLTVGVTVGYDYGKADIHNSGGKIESDDVRITLFAGQQIGEMFFVNAGAQVGYGHYEAKRKTAYGNANGDTDGWNAGLFADVGMMLTLSEELKIAARPYVGLAYLHSEVGSFDDNIFDVDDFHGDSLRASIGCGVFWGFDLAEAAWTVGLDASYSHDFCGDEVDIDATCMSTDKDFGITAKALSKDLFSVGPTVSVGLTKNIDIFAGYAFQAGTDSSTGHNLNAGLKVTF